MFKDKKIWKQETEEAVQILTKLYPVFILLYLFYLVIHFIWPVSWLARIINFYGITVSLIVWGLIVVIPIVVKNKKGDINKNKIRWHLVSVGSVTLKTILSNSFNWLKKIWFWLVWGLALLWRAICSIWAWWLADPYRLSIVLVVLLGSIYLKFTLPDSLVALFATATFLFRWDSRISASLAMLFLVACPFLLSFGKDQLAEVSAVYAFYFLVITVAVQIWDLARGSQAR